MFLYLIPFISAFIGWFTNWIAIKMLFHPVQEKNILGIKIQGIFPKRQKQFAEKLGLLVAEELISFDDIKQKLIDPNAIQQLKPMIDEHLERFIKTKLTEKLPIISMFVGNDSIKKIQESISEELLEILPVLIEQYSSKIEGELDIRKIVTQKVESFSSDKLEAILNAIMKREFRFVEIIGGVLGFIIGLLQVALTLLSK